MLESMKETLKVESCIKKNPWLIEMVKSNLFHRYCDQHTTKLRCHFCCECMVAPLCETCFKDNIDHKDHLMIQAYRSSQETGVRKEIISKYMDISGIHIYKINKYLIIYIKQRRVEDKNLHCRNNVSRKCKVCEWELNAASSSLFCSVQCKFKSALGSKLDELMGTSSEENKSNSDVTEISEEVVKKKRKHRRKGIPHRAPLC